MGVQIVLQIPANVFPVFQGYNPSFNSKNEADLSPYSFLLETASEWSRICDLGLLLNFVNRCRITLMGDKDSREDRRSARADRFYPLRVV
jgi:hypothetical protein